jgi:hypothetical protein
MPPKGMQLEPRGITAKRLPATRGSGWMAIPKDFPDVESDAVCHMPDHSHGINVIKSNA